MLWRVIRSVRNILRQRLQGHNAPSRVKVRGVGSVSLFGGSLKTLVLDIETSPNLAHVWDLWNQNVGISQLQEASEVLCVASKWLDAEEMFFFSNWGDGHHGMISGVHALLEEADAVVHYNGKAFDMPHLNREFVVAGFLPPKPYSQIDLYTTVKKRFKFASNKLDYVAQALGLGAKMHHSGHELWVKVLAGDRDAENTMQLYNEQDVLLTEKLYKKLLPWIPSHPNVGLIDGTSGCTVCGSANMVERETTQTAMSKFPVYQCTNCGHWDRTTGRMEGSKLRSVAW